MPTRQPRKPLSGPEPQVLPRCLDTSVETAGTSACATSPTQGFHAFRWAGGPAHGDRHECIPAPGRMDSDENPIQCGAVDPGRRRLLAGAWPRLRLGWQAEACPTWFSRVSAPRHLRRVLFIWLRPGVAWPLLVPHHILQHLFRRLKVGIDFQSCFQLALCLLKPSETGEHESRL